MGEDHQDATRGGWWSTGMMPTATLVVSFVTMLQVPYLSPLLS
jgi:hypothetical protein